MPTAVSLPPAGDGSFSQNVQRLGFYAEDSWRVNSGLTMNYGLRYDTTFGLFIASGRDQSFNPALSTRTRERHPCMTIARRLLPVLGIAQTLGSSQKTIFRAGVGIYYDDLAQAAGSPRFNPSMPEACEWPDYSSADRSQLPHALRAARHRWRSTRTFQELDAQWRFYD